MSVSNADILKSSQQKSILRPPETPAIRVQQPVAGESAAQQKAGCSSAEHTRLAVNRQLHWEYMRQSFLCPAFSSFKCPTKCSTVPLPVWSPNTFEP